MSDTALIGQTIAGRFRVTGFIGEGAMASVYRGIQAAEPRDVAIKIMHPHLVRDSTFAGRFRREAKAASLLKHPNTVHIVDYGADGEQLYIAMELITGQDLFEMLVLERRFSESRAARIVAQVLDALTAAHGRGIIHRDLKPENVMVIQDGRRPGFEHVKVLDFGIAKIVERDRKGNLAGPPNSESEDNPQSLVHSALTTVGVVVGTPAYMSPEQCRAEPVDARSDIYSCGILLYQLVCGRTPFTGDSPIEIAINQVRMAPDPPSTIVPGIEPELERIILTALEKWPAQRQQSAAEMRDALVKVLPRLSTEKKPLSDGRAPSPAEVYAEDPPPSSDGSDMAKTIRREEGLGPQPTPTLRPGQYPVAPQAAQAPAQPGPMQSAPAARPPSLGRTLVSPVNSIPQAGPSSDPMSGPSSIEVFPRPLGPPVAQRPLPDVATTLPAGARMPAPIMPAPVAPPQPTPEQAALAAAAAAPQGGLPTWLVLVIAILVGVTVGLAAHFLVAR